MRVPCGFYVDVEERTYRRDLATFITWLNYSSYVPSSYEWRILTSSLDRIYYRDTDCAFLIGFLLGTPYRNRHAGFFVKRWALPLYLGLLGSEIQGSLESVRRPARDFFLASSEFASPFGQAAAKVMNARESEFTREREREKLRDQEQEKQNAKRKKLMLTRKKSSTRGGQTASTPDSDEDRIRSPAQVGAHAIYNTLFENNVKGRRAAEALWESAPTCVAPSSDVTPVETTMLYSRNAVGRGQKKGVTASVTTSRPLPRFDGHHGRTIKLVEEPSWKMAWLRLTFPLILGANGPRLPEKSHSVLSALLGLPAPILRFDVTGSQAANMTQKQIQDEAKKIDDALKEKTLSEVRFAFVATAMSTVAAIAGRLLLLHTMTSFFSGSAINDPLPTDVAATLYSIAIEGQNPLAKRKPPPTPTAEVSSPETTSSDEPSAEHGQEEKRGVKKSRPAATSASATKVSLSQGPGTPATVGSAVGGGEDLVPAKKEVQATVVLKLNLQTRFCHWPVFEWITVGTDTQWVYAVSSTLHPVWSVPWPELSTAASDARKLFTAQRLTPLQRFWWNFQNFTVDRT